MEAETTTMHLGRKISRIRELKGMKQETLAAAMGVSQQAISKLEQSEQVDEEKLQQVAEKLGVTADAIKNFNEDAIINIVSSTLHDQSGSIHYNFNPLEKLMEVIEENKKLYERMLKDKDAMIEKLERLLGAQK